LKRPDGRNCSGVATHGRIHTSHDIEAPFSNTWQSVARLLLLATRASIGAVVVNFQIAVFAVGHRHPVRERIGAGLADGRLRQHLLASRLQIRLDVVRSRLGTLGAVGCRREAPKRLGPVKQDEVLHLLPLVSSTRYWLRARCTRFAIAERLYLNFRAAWP